MNIRAYETTDGSEETVSLSTDTGVRKTLWNKTDWNKIKSHATLVKTSKLFRPYGTQYHLPIIGRAYVAIRSENGAVINTWVYIVSSTKESSLLGKTGAVRLRIVTINLKGSEKEVTINKIDFVTKFALSK